MITTRLVDGNICSLKQFRRCISFFKSKPETPKVESVTPEPEVIDIKTPEKIVIPKRNLTFLPPAQQVRQAWVENLDTIESNNLGIIDLHPSIFGARLRLDLIYKNYNWQRKYKHINWTFMPWKHEIKKSLRKAWPQKGMGRHHAGSRRTPPFLGAVKMFGPRGPKSYYFEIYHGERVHGLCSMLSVKLAQEDLHIVKSLEIPSDDPQYLLDLAEHRKWGPAILLVDVIDIMPRNIAIASNTIKHINLMPVYGLDVYSMLKHHTLVLTVDAVEKIESKLLQHLHGPLAESTEACIRRYD